MKKHIAKLSRKERFSKDVMKLFKLSKSFMVAPSHLDLHIQKKQSKKESNNF